jgi:predicted porin
MALNRKFYIGLLTVSSGLVCSGAAQAQSTVTLYGTVDAGLIYTNKTLNMTTLQNAGKQFGYTDSGLSASRFGLYGTEDLGGGLSAEFKLESGYDTGTGGYNDSNGYLFGREAYVGLKGGFGEVKAGLQYSPFADEVDALDPRGLSQFASSLIVNSDNLIAASWFVPNAVSYKSPVLWGFQAAGMVSLGGVAGDFRNGFQYSGSLKYDNGTVMVSASFFEAQPSTGSALMTPVPTQFPVEVEGRQLGVSYKIGRLTAKASFVNYKEGSVSNNVYGGGLNFLATNQLDVNGGVWYEQQSRVAANHSLLVGLGSNYYLSRTTTVYAQAGLVNNGGTMDTGLSIDTPLGATGTTLGVDVGIRHVF